MRFALALGLMVCGLCFAETETKKEKPAQAVEIACSSPKETRSIRHEKKNGGCEILYTKDGKTQSVASARNEEDYCDRVVKQMTDTLTGAGFQCH